MSRSRKADASGTYEVGYGKPPQHTRFQKGRSGNPKGRRRTEAVGDVLEQELGRLIDVRQGDRSVQLTALQALVRTTIASALKGNAPAQRAFLKLIQDRAREEQVAQAQFVQSAVAFQVEAEAERERREARGEAGPSPVDASLVRVDLATGEVEIDPKLLVRRPAES
ncbi:DUF5681 domain-containing protein [Salinarimonas soli]|uniref:DUF5681 domain-containing protein n=1 Tax=Salinarimonas soli TaxID=1638099 RepID=A0A5B2VB61_9HYPH|nr:DUF5681 domain-containing protein [Salinarimonas soli]KAA2235996.1 hypothetical protein F0L46_17185 [Salinarimonas soli]